MRLRLILVVALLLLWSPGSRLKAQGAELSVTSPMPGEVVTGTSVTVHFDAVGVTIVPSSVLVEEAGKHPEANRPGEGHLHLMLDLQPLVIWSSAEPYTFSDVPAGEHQLMVEVVNNDHSSLAPPAVVQLRFRSLGESSPAATSDTQLGTLPNTGIDQSLPATRQRLLIICITLILCGFIVRRR